MRMHIRLTGFLIVHFPISLPNMLSVQIPEVKYLSVVHAAIGAEFAAALLYNVPTPSKRTKTNKGVQVRQAHHLRISLPVLGDIREIANNVLRYNERIYENRLRFNGEPWVQRVPIGPDMMFISTPELIEDVTKTQNDVFQPEIEAKIRAELWKKVPDLMEGKVSALTMEQASDLTYLDAVIRETI